MTRTMKLLTLVAAVVFAAAVLSDTLQAAPKKPKPSPQFRIIQTATADGGYGLPDEPRGLFFDKRNRVYATGYMTVPGEGRNIWLAKYNPSLKLQKSVTLDGGAGGDDEGYGVAMARNGCLYVVGYVTEAGQDHNIWLAKFDRNLVLKKQITVNGSDNSTDDGYGIICDKAGNVYIAGTLSETGQGYNIFVAKYDRNLNLLDSVTIDGPASNTDKARFLAFDSAGNLYVSGSASQTLTGYDIWIGKFDKDLDLSKSIIVAGPTDDEDKGYGILFDKSDTLYVTGTMMVSGQDRNIWLAKYDTDLNLLDETSLNDPSDGEDVAYSIAMDKWGYVYQTGVWTEASGGSNVWVALFDAELDLMTSTTFAGDAGQYDTGLGIVKGNGRDVYVSAALTEDADGVNIRLFRYRIYHLRNPKSIK